MGVAARDRDTLGNRYVDAAGRRGESIIDKQRTENWTYEREHDDGNSPYVVRSAGKIVCRVRSAEIADTICTRRNALLREAGQRAADLRRHAVEMKQFKDDVRLLMKTLEQVSQVLRLVKPRDVIRAREEVRRILRRMHGRGYTT